MTLNKISMVYGCKLDKFQVLIFLLGCEVWMKEMRKKMSSKKKSVRRHVPLVLPMIEQVKNVINNESDKCVECVENENFNTKEKISEFINDWGILYNITELYTINNISIGIFLITHDIDEGDNCIIGVKLVDIKIKSKFDFIDMSKINNSSFSEKIATFTQEIEKYNMTDCKIHTIQDDCTCCS